MFSFNNPNGACSNCDGLGIEQSFSTDMIIEEPTKTIAEGAVRGWDKGNRYYYHLLTCLSKHYGFRLDVPYKNLRQKDKDVILLGTKGERIDVSWTLPNGRKIKRFSAWEGVVPNLERRFRETKSNAVREALAKYQSKHALF